MMKYIICFFVLLSCILQVTGQDFDAMSHNLAVQTYNYPQEKIHVMTDKSLYITGDTVWMRAFVVDAVSHQPVDVSKFVYVELRDPMGGAVLRVKIKERDGIMKGYLALDPTTVAEGDYTLVAYTWFMQNQGERYFFKKPLRIRSSFALKRKIDYEFEWKNEGKENESLKINMRYLDTETGEPAHYNSFCYRKPGGKIVDYTGGERNLSIEMSHKELAAGCVFVKYGNYGKYITFPSSSVKTFDVSFYPEGGYLVPGVSNRMTMKAMDSGGIPVNVTGKLIDSSGNEVADLVTGHESMGLAEFIPRPGMSYKAVMNHEAMGEKAFELPAVRGDATVLQCVREGNIVTLRAVGADPYSTTIAVQQRGRLLAAGNGSVAIATDTLPAGVAQAVLIDGKGRMYSERLFFITGKLTPQATVRSDKAQYDSRDLVQMSVDLSELSDTASNFAVSVTDNRSIAPDSATSILTTLLLQSDLQGRVANPAWYFSALGRERDLDMLMMTQGWRRYDIPHALTGRILEPQYPIEKGQTLSGTIRSEWRKKLMENAMIKVMAPRIGYADAAVSDENGRWTIDNVVFPDSTKFILQATNKKGGELSNLAVDKDAFPAVSALEFSRLQANDGNGQGIAEEVTFISNAKRRLQYVDGVQSVLLDEIVVTKKKRTKPISIFEMVADRSHDYQFFEDRSITDYETALRYFPGIVVTPNGLKSMRDRSELIGIMVDGVPFEGYEGASVGGMTYSVNKTDSRSAHVLMQSTDDSFRMLKDMYPFDIVKQIDFIHGAAAMAFGGGKYKGGLISITTKDGTEKKRKNNFSTIKTVIPLGYQRPAEFYAPRYDTGNNGIGEGADLRETLYWNPCVRSDSTGHARFNFYTNDVPATSYTVTIEGVTPAGELIRATRQIKKN